MKKKLMCAFAFFICFFDIVSAQFIWQWSHPFPQGNRLHYIKIVSDNHFVALGESGTCLNTSNAGMNWSIYHHSLDSLPVDFYGGWFFNMSTGLACGRYGNIWRTTNSGKNWNVIPSGVGTDLARIYFKDIYTGYISGKRAGNIPGCLLKTTNAGINWSMIFSSLGIEFEFVYAIDNRIYLPVNYPFGNGIYTSYDEGLNWFTNIVDPIYATWNVCFKDTLNGIASYSNKIWTTTNAGVNWAITSEGLSDGMFYDLKSYNGNYFAVGHPRYLFKSSTNGLSWDTINTGIINENAFYRNFNVFGSNIIMCGEYGVLNYTSNSGINWIHINNALNISSIMNIWCENMSGKAVATGAPTPKHSLFTTNGGQNWFASTGINSSDWIHDLKMVNSNTGFACIGSDGSVFRTTNCGVSWEEVSNHGIFSSYINLDFINPDTGWICGPYYILKKTTNGGLNWILAYNSSNEPFWDVDFVNSQTGWLVGGLIKKTTNGGINWITQIPNISNFLFFNMIDENVGFISTGGGIDHIECELRRTTNGGANWEHIPVPLSSTDYYVFSFINENTGMNIIKTGHVMRTSDGGANWEIGYCGSKNIFTVYVKGYDSAYIGGTYGIVKFNKNIVNKITWKNSVQKDFFLNQNYPNPFNSKTKITFSLPRKSKISLKIFDITGREIEILLRDVEMNPGTVYCTFDGSKLSSGIYFYKLLAGDFSEVKKMVLTK